MPFIKTRLISLGVAIGLGALAMKILAEAPKGITPTAQDRIALAKRIYFERILVDFERMLAPPDDRASPQSNWMFKEELAEYLHKWSVRLMEAEFSGSLNQADRVAAAQAHLDRMKSIESGTISKELTGHPAIDGKYKENLLNLNIVEIRKQAGVEKIVKAYCDVARYFRLEAEDLLAKEKARR